MSKPAPAKKESQGQFTWRVRRKTSQADTPWKSGGPADIMEVVLRRLESLEEFEKATMEIEKRIDALDKNIIAVAQDSLQHLPDVEFKELFVPKPKEASPKPEIAMPKPKEPTPPPAPVVPKEEPKPKAAAPVAAAPKPASAAAPAGVKHETMEREALATTGMLLQQLQQPAKALAPQKVAVIGAGPVGMNVAFAMLNQGIATEIALVDKDDAKLKAEAMDMQYGMGFVKNSKVVASTDVAVTANSRLVVLTVGQGDGKMTAAELAQKNIVAFKAIIPKILEMSPHANLLVVSNPVDLMTYAAWKISGLPAHRVVGTGTNLDSNRFRGMIADKLKLNSADCTGWVIGQQGANSIPVWSGVNVAGENLKALNPTMGGPDDKENWNLCHLQVVSNAEEINKTKQSASMAISMSAASLARALLHNSREVFAVSTMVKGYHGLTDEVFLSLPCVLGDFGVCDVIKQTLQPDEVEKLKSGTAAMKTLVESLKL